MTRLGFDGLVSGAEHSKDDAGLGMRWDFLDIPLGFDLGDGDGEGDRDVVEVSTGRHPGKYSSK